MNDKMMQQMAKMVDALQPHCDEEIIAAMTCSKAGSMNSGLLFKLLSGGEKHKQSIKLPNPVFIGVGEKTIYAFAYVPKGFKYKIKKEVTRWSRDKVRIEAESEGPMATFVLNTQSGDSYPFEILTIMGARGLVDMFLEALVSSPE